MIRRVLLLSLLVSLLTAGCGLMKRVPNTFYTLDTIPGAAAATNIAGTPIGIDGIELPPGLDRREVTARQSDNKLDVRGHHQWASPLEDMVTPGYLDGRVFALYAGMPCLVYGPVSQNIHGFDERVSLASVKRVTGTIALFIAEWCGLEKA